jgi:hypothetical protein
MFGDDFRDLVRRVDVLENLFRVDGMLRDILRKEELIMATVTDLQGKLDAMAPVLDAIVVDVQATKTEIQALKDQIAAGTPVSQAQLDALDAQADGVLQRLGAIDSSVPGTAGP